MSETVVGRIVITRVLTEDGVTIDHRNIDDGSGDELDQTTAVAMLAVAQHAILCEGF